MANDDGYALTVRWEPCEEFRCDDDRDWPFCTRCGWLVGDHDNAKAGHT